MDVSGSHKWTWSFAFFHVAWALFDLKRELGKGEEINNGKVLLRTREAEQTCL